MSDALPVTDAARVLRARARALAKPSAADHSGPRIEVLRFRLTGEYYAAEVRHVREVLPLRELTPLPGVPPFVRGVVHARGRLLPVYDLRRFFDMPGEGLADLHGILVLQNARFELGLLIDIVQDVTGLDPSALQPPPASFTGIRAEYLLGLAPGPLAVLAADRILDDPRILIDIHDS